MVKLQEDAGDNDWARYPHLVQCTKKPDVFVGSSAEGLGIARAICSQLRAIAMLRMWTVVDAIMALRYGVAHQYGLQGSYRFIYWAELTNSLPYLVTRRA